MGAFLAVWSVAVARCDPPWGCCTRLMGLFHALGWIGPMQRTRTRLETAMGHRKQQTDFVGAHHKTIAVLRQCEAHKAQLAVRRPLAVHLALRGGAAWLAPKVTPIGVLTILGRAGFESRPSLDKTPRKLLVQSKSSI